MAGIRGFFFDMDGVIIDTERHGHRVAFNKAFEEFAIPVEWDEETYHELLQVAGGKERMRHYLHTRGFGIPVSEQEEDELILKLHKRKTDLFLELLESGTLPLRPGVRRFMEEVRERELILGVCTTSNERAAEAVTQKILTGISFDVVLAGDMVSKKKPDPEIYRLAMERTGLNADQCVVIEDSRNGVLAAKAAGMHVVATSNQYTEQEDLREADIVVTCLGDRDGEKGTLTHGGARLDYDGVLTVGQLVDYFRG